MCFSNLPVEFDEEGNPFLAEEADEVDGLPDAGADTGPDAACGCTGDVPLAEADPESVYEDVLETLPKDVRDRVAGGVESGAVDGHERTAGGD